MKLIKKRKIKLKELPKGRLFKYGDTIGVKSEYRSESGAIEAFIIGSGEMFWGGTAHASKQRELEVIEIEIMGNEDFDGINWDVVTCEGKVLEQITCWYRFDKHTQSYKFNHWSYGWGLGLKPTPILEDVQEEWKSSKWLKGECYFDEVEKKVIQVDTL